MRVAVQLNLGVGLASALGLEEGMAMDQGVSLAVTQTMWPCPTLFTSKFEPRDETETLKSFTWLADKVARKASVSFVICDMLRLVLLLFRATLLAEGALRDQACRE